MIFDYPSKKFIEDGQRSRLLISGFAFIVSEPVSFARPMDDAPMEDSASVVKDVEFRFTNGVLQVYGGDKRITNITKLLFIMSESEISAAQEQSYRRVSDSGHSRHIFEPDVKLALQEAINKIAINCEIKLPENINFFNDKFILYLFPLLRTLTNSSTNFYKILEDLRFSEDSGEYADGYMLSHVTLEQNSIADALKISTGTSSKVLTKFVAHNIVRKTDLVKSLSPQLLDILINHSGRIFSSSNDGIPLPEVKILTCYEDVLLDVFAYVRYAMDIFNNNIDHVQKFLNGRERSNDNFRTNKKVAKFLAENLTPAKIFNVIDDKGAYISTVTDILNQYNNYKSPTRIPGKLRTQYPNGLELPKNWKNLKELHDKVSADYNKIKAEDNNKVIEYSPIEFQLHGLKEGNIELMLPSEGSTLVNWGREQSHCVASYADRAAQKSCIIMGVKIDDVHKYTLELRTHEIQRAKPLTPQTAIGLEELSDVSIERETVLSCDVVQFRGQNNSNPETEHKERVYNMLREVFINVTNGGNMVGQLAELQRALEAGNYNAAPGDLMQGAALQVEPLDMLFQANN